MPKYYIVSKYELQESYTFELESNSERFALHTVTDIYTEKDIVSKCRELFPDGISRHGDLYSMGKISFENINGTDYAPYIQMIEWTFELVRRYRFQDLPSRFTCVFGCETLEDSQNFNRNCRNNQGIIYEVDAENGFKADMNLLLLGGSFFGNQILAEKYWNGEAGKNPFWEILMSGQINIIRRIN